VNRSAGPSATNIPNIISDAAKKTTFRQKDPRCVCLCV